MREKQMNGLSLLTDKQEKVLRMYIINKPYSYAEIARENKGIYQKQ